MKQTLLNKNLNKLRKNHPKLAYDIGHIDPTNVEFCFTQAEEPNLKRTYQGKTYYYHSEENALNEAKEWFKQLSLENISVIFIYGVGLGYYYEVAKEWLAQKKDRFLVFVEEDLGVLHRLLETERGTILLKHPQIKLVHFSNLLDDKEIFNELSWTFILSPFLITSLKLYEDVNPTGCIELANQLSFDANQKKTLVEEYLQYGIPFFRNFYPNLLEIPKSYLGNKLFNQFKNVPAIICGAGPSLNKNFDVLKTLKDKALIFAGSSSLPAFASRQFPPHFGVAIDPNNGQVSRVKSIKDFQIPFFYRSRLFHDALKNINGPKLYLTGTGGYNIAKWFEEKLHINDENDLDEGHNVVNFCIEIAQALGCNPIILVGVDLALTGQQYYADGVAEKLNFKETELNHIKNFDGQPILRNDIYGDPIFTFWKWVTEAEWISDYAKEHPELTIINATEGGIGFKDVPNMSLKEAKETYLKENNDSLKHIQDEINKSSLANIDIQDIKNTISLLQNSLVNCVKKMNIIFEEMTLLEEKLKKGIAIPDNLQTPTIMLSEMEIDSEPAFQYLLETFSLIFLRINHRLIQSFHLTNKPSKAQAKKKIKLHKERLKFLSEVALVNIELIKRTLA